MLALEFLRLRRSRLFLGEPLMRELLLLLNSLPLLVLLRAQRLLLLQVFTLQG